MLTECICWKLNRFEFLFKCLTMFPLLSKTITKDELNGNGKMPDFWTMNGDVVCLPNPNVCHFKGLNETAANYVWGNWSRQKKVQRKLMITASQTQESVKWTPPPYLIHILIKVSFCFIKYLPFINLTIHFLGDAMEERRLFSILFWKDISEYYRASLNIASYNIYPPIKIIYGALTEKYK